MWHSQRCAQFASHSDQVLDEIVLIRVGELKCQSLTPEHFRTKLVAPDKHGARCDSFLAPAVGFEPTTNRLIPTLSGLYHWATISIQATEFESSARISTI